MFLISKFTSLLLVIFLASCASLQQQQSTPSLLDTEWLLEDLGGKGVLDRIQATLAFPAPNKAAGNGSCNRFFGGVEIKGETIKFDQLATTLMACPSEAISNQESNYLLALQKAERVVIDGPFLLIYAKELDKPLRFTRISHTGKPQ